MEPADGVFIIVTEDLQGLTVGHQVKAMSRQVLAAARTIAPLHARWWNGDQRQLLPWVPSVEQELATLSLTPAVLRTAWPLFLEPLMCDPGARADEPV